MLGIRDAVVFALSLLAIMICLPFLLVIAPIFFTIWLIDPETIDRRLSRVRFNYEDDTDE
jgi:hypothetical protein